MPYEYSLKLKENRSVLDSVEKNEKHLRLAEKAYVELSELYNWDKIECVDIDEIKSIDTINAEIFELVKDI